MTIDLMEKKEQMIEQMENIKERKVTAYQCYACKKTTNHFPSFCNEKGHIASQHHFKIARSASFVKMLSPMPKLMGIHATLTFSSPLNPRVLVRGHF